MFYSNKVKAILIILSAALLASCGGQVSSMQFNAAGKTIIDESESVLQSAPFDVQPVGKDEVAFINRDELCVYNTTTGKRLRAFGSRSLNSDSLVRNTVGLQLKDSITILPPDSESRPESGSRAVAFTFSENEFIIYYYIEYRSRFKSDAAIRAAIDEMDPDSKKKLQAQLHDGQLPSFTNYDVARYFIITDPQFHIKRILQSDETSFATTAYGTFHLFPGTGFFRSGTRLTMQVFDQSSPSMLTPDQRIRSSDSLPLIGEVELTDSSVRWKRELLNTRDIPSYNCSSSEYGFTQHCFHSWHDTLVVSTEAGWFTLPDKKTFPVQPKAGQGERVRGSFDRVKGRYLYCTGRLNSKGYFEKNGLALHLFNPSGAREEAQLPVTCTSFVLRGDTVLLVGHDTEHYFFERYVVTDR